MYYIYDTIEEVTAIDKAVCIGEGISIERSNTSSYALPIPTNDGKYAYIADEVTSKYITDRVAQETSF